MNENIAVYEALRAHILQKESEIINEIIYMYVTYFALLAIGTIWNSWLSLIAFVDLIVFQSMINSAQWSITKATTYIKVFFETERSDIHWELLHMDDFYLSVYSSINQNVGWYIRKYGASFLAIISLFSIVAPALHASDYDLSLLSNSTTAQIVFAILLCGVTIHMNLLYFHSRNDNGQAVQKLYRSIEAFKENEIRKLNKHQAP